jgi:acetolactate synthase-1/2/3 large subunit
MMGHAFRSKAGQRISPRTVTPDGLRARRSDGRLVREPTRPIICIIGDGGMQLNIQEPADHQNYGVKVTVFIINNHVLGIRSPTSA